MDDTENQVDDSPEAAGIRWLEQAQEHGLTRTLQVWDGTEWRDVPVVREP